jgi:hypothetical protein
MIFYCDYEGGQDAGKDGQSYSQRWKTLTNGPTAALIAPGDTIRMMASPDPTSLGQNGTWTDGPLAATFIPTSSTNATPIVFTKSGHGLVTGDTVIVNAHTTNTNANGVWKVSVSGTTFTLLNADGSNSVGNGVGGATGTVRKISNGVVALASAITANIASSGNQGSAGKANWTASANVTCSNLTTDYKEGFSCQQIAVAAGFTTGLAAYFATGTLNLSAYRQVSFWIKQTAGVIGAAGTVKLILCSDTAGATQVNVIDIPLLGALSRWSPITVDLASALGSSIQSIGFFVSTDNAAQTFLLDNIIACKNSSSADSLSLTSLIGKNTGTEGWYGLQSINGTRVMLDMDTNNIPGATPSRGYSGTTGTVTAYKRETIKTDMAALAATAIQVCNDSGTDGVPITYSGGWNRTDMSTQTGETYFDGQNGLGVGLTINTGLNYNELSQLSGCRYTKILDLLTNSFCKATLGSVSNCTSPIVLSNSNFNDFIAGNLNNSLSSQITLTGTSGSPSDFNTFQITNCNNTDVGSNGGVINLVSGNNNKFNILNGRNNTFNLILMQAGSDNRFTVGDCSGTILGVRYANAGNAPNSCSNNFMINSFLNATAKVTMVGSGMLWSTNENGDANTHFGYSILGLISSDAVTVRTAGLSWKLSPTTSSCVSRRPLRLKVATAQVAANTPITCKVWFRRTNTGLTARLICKGGQLTGIDNDVSSSMTAAANTWEQLSVTVTPTQKGVLEFFAEGWGGTTFSAFVDDVSFT